jgi:diketogulonate reductase-like aldo/keto reductase
MLKLNDGHTLPAVGFGTYKLNGIAGSQAIEGALGNGYRLLDTAFNYENEGAVGAAVRRSDVPREQIIISSKLPGRHHAYAEALATIEESVYRTGLDHLDLYLIHWPNPKQGKYVEAWKALIEARRRGLVTSIGVSNFLPEHLQRLIDETGVTPAVNQIEMHPYFPQAEQHAWDAAHGIVDEAWSPLGRANSLLRDPAIQRIADAHRRSLVQVVLRWHVQLGVIPLPKATHAERQMQNLSLFDFELSPEEMAEITALGRPDGRTANQDPAEYEEF